jgi:hypothetical protein
LAERLATSRLATSRLPERLLAERLLRWALRASPPSTAASSTRQSAGTVGLTGRVAAAPASGAADAARLLRQLHGHEDPIAIALLAFVEPQRLLLALAHHADEPWTALPGTGLRGLDRR